MRRIEKCLLLLLLFAALSLLPLASCGEPGGPEPGVSAVPTVQVDWNSGVRTDYSFLTPYEPVEEKFTRLSEGALPELTPSPDYGRLLPYVGDKLFGGSYGLQRVTRFGLVTQDGMIVTDPVYTSVRQGYTLDTDGLNFYPAYTLMTISETDEILYGACALDGSWVTPTDYVGIAFADEVFMLLRDHATNDIDVMDYDGNFLFNVKSLACYGDIAPGALNDIVAGCGGGLIAFPLTGGETAYVDAARGEVVHTESGEGQAFQDGRAAVLRDGLWGYMDSDFKLAIAPQFASALPFADGKGIVLYPGGSYAVIDTAGNVLLTTSSDVFRIDAMPYGYRLFGSSTQFYDGAFKPISVEGHSLQSTGGGFLYYRTDDGVTLLRDGQSYDLPDVNGILEVAGGLVSVSAGSAHTGSIEAIGLMTLDGAVLVPLQKDIYVSLAQREESGDVVAVVSEYDTVRGNDTYRVLDASGSTLFSGIGNARYLADCDLFELSCDQWFGFAHISGDFVFKVSLMASLPD